jgi:hypothetical protein
MQSTQHPSQWVPWCSFPSGKEVGTMRLNTYFYLVPSLRMNGVLLSLSLYAFMTSTGTTSYLSYLSPPFSFAYSFIPGRFPPALVIIPLSFLKMEIVKFSKQSM